MAIDIKYKNSRSVCFETHEAGTMKRAAIEVDNRHYIFIPKNKKAEKKLNEWIYTVYYNKANKTLKQKEDELQFLCNTILFTILNNSKEAYKEFLRISKKHSEAILKNSAPSIIPLRPDKDFELLKEWFDECWEIKKKQLQVTVSYNDKEIVKHLEIEFIEDQIAETKRLYFTKPPSNNKRALQPFELEALRKLKENTISIEKINNRAFLEWLENRKAELVTSASKKPLEKIRWLGKPSQLGYIFSQFVEKGFIELPTSRGDGSYAKLAKLCFDYFDVRNEKGQSTTLGNLEREFNPNKNSLSNSIRGKFEIPDKSAL